MLFTGCAYIQSPRTPLNTIYYSNGSPKADTLLVLLPGMGSRAEDFIKNDFLRQIETAGVKADAVLVDAYLRYYLQRNILVRLQEDVILPAQEKGYKNLWLVGISMGGLGTLLYAKEHPQVLKGMVLLAPFLGEEKLIEEIWSAGGVRNWRAKMPLTDENYQEMIWDWLKAYSQSDQARPRLLLGFGTEDPFYRANSLLGEVVPKEQVYTQPGGHDWQTWRSIFYKMLIDHF
ncbi:MAG: alpha/beta fold hydrolase [Thermodesulfobacteriota bacterium]